MLIDEDPHIAWMQFEAQIIPYIGDDSWVEPALFKIKDLLVEKDCPEHTEKCENERFLKEANLALNIN